MAEIMEEKKELTPAETAVPAAPETPKEAEKSPVSKKKRRRMIRRIIALVVVAALIAGGVLYFRGKSGGASSEAGTATVEYGAIKMCIRDSIKTVADLAGKNVSVGAAAVSYTHLG